MSKNYLPVLGLVIFMFTAGAGCGISLNSKKPSLDGGVYKSIDKGLTWTQKVAVPTLGGNLSIASLNVNKFVPDPRDKNTFYLGTQGSGIYVTYDAGESWRQLVGEMGIGDVKTVAIDPLYNCTLYVGRANMVWKTIDCGRNWERKFFDDRVGQVVDVAIDPDNNANIYVASLSGSIFVSTDYGANWSLVLVVKEKPTEFRFVPSPAGYDLYLATQNNGLYKYFSNTKDWQILEGSKQINNGQNYVDMKVVLGEINTFYYVTRNGILKTENGGQDWVDLKLLTETANTEIYSFAVNTANTAEVYYATPRTFYYSSDGGVTWQTSKLITNRIPTYLYLDPTVSNVLYMMPFHFQQK